MTRRLIAPTSLLSLTSLLLLAPACNGGDAETSASSTSNATDGSDTTGTSLMTTSVGTSTTAPTASATDSDSATTGDSDTDGTTTGTDSATTSDSDTDGTTTDGTTTGGEVSPFPVMVGDVGPIADDNPRQYPFACRTLDMDLGWPEIDNNDGKGLPIADDDDNIVGYSRDCGVKTRVDYFYMSTEPPEGGGLLPYNIDDPPADVAMIEIDGEMHKYVVRFERGTINRFVYGIGMIAPDDPDLNTPDLSAWNDKLIFWFGGGVGIGHQQSSGLAVSRLRDAAAENPTKNGPLFQPLLEQGYAIVYSSGTVTDTTYNLLLTGETAVMVKEQFKAMYAEPKYTFGFGGSGGAVQQLIYEQNHPDLLDGLVPTHSYPDMIGQTTRIGDCERLEYFFDVTDKDNPKWSSWENRQLIEGLNGIDGFDDSDWDFFNQGKPIGSSAGPGSTECIEGWRGLTPLTMNPLWVNLNDDSYALLLDTEPETITSTPWSYWDDVIEVFGVDPDSDGGYARRTWDNVGVQYGLQALVDGELSPDEFIHLNARIGGYLGPDEMVQEGFPFGSENPDDLDPWSARNSSTSLDLEIAPRTVGNIEAMQQAYYSGLVFHGDIDAPVITILPYLEAELNMHNAKQPFAIRARIEEAVGNSDKHLIWAVGDKGEHVMVVSMQAFKTLEQWLDDDAKPDDALDGCYDADFQLIAAGDAVWKGVLTADDKDNGSCAAAYPVFADPRMVAGEDITTDVFKCATKTLDTAMDDGTYGDVTWSQDQVSLLGEIFGESGVCDYSKPDLGRPEDL